MLPKGQLCLPNEEFLVISTFNFMTWINKLTTTLQAANKLVEPFIIKSQVEPISLRQKRAVAQTLETASVGAIPNRTPAPVVTQRTAVTQTIDLPIIDALSAFHIHVQASTLIHTLGHEISGQFFSMYHTAPTLPSPYDGTYNFLPGVNSPFFKNSLNLAYIGLGQSFDIRTLSIFHAFMFDVSMNRTKIPIKGAEAQFSASSDFERLQFATDLIENIASIFNSIEQTIFALRNNLLPPQLYNNSHLDEVLSHLNIRYPDLIPLEELKDILYSVPTTSVTKSTCTTKTMYCPINFVTRIPIITKNEKYKIFQLVSLPTFHESFTANQWKTLDIPEETILYNNVSVSPIDFENDLKCENILSESPCQVCHKKIVNRKPFSDCFQSIINDKDPWNNCEATTLSEVYDQVYRLNDQQFAFTDINPGVITEECADRDKQIVPMPHTGILTMSPTCEYKILNGPFKSDDIDNSKVTIISGDDTHEVVIQEIPTNKIHEHIKDYGFEYVIVLSSIVLTIPFAFLGIFCLRRRQRIVRRARRRTRTAMRERLRTNRATTTLVTTQSTAPALYRSALVQLLTNQPEVPPPPRSFWA